MLSLNSRDRIVHLMVLVLVFATGVFAANQDSAASWIVGVGLPLGPFQGAPLYVCASDLWGSLANYAGVDVISAEKTVRLDSIIMTAAYTAGLENH